MRNQIINRTKTITLFATSFLVFLCLFTSLPLLAHGVDSATEQFLINNNSVALIPFMYIGAKHMLTGYDHLLFLFGVIFFLYKSKDIIVYVSLFTIGHSLTLLFGVFNDIQLNPYLIDAVIGFSIVYKGFDNLNGFKTLFGIQPNIKVIIFIFGLFHGFGLATKLQEFKFNQEGLLQNMIAFNVGVEIGQFLALGLALIILNSWRKFPSFNKFSTPANSLLMCAGFVLIMYQLTGYYLNH